MASLFDLVGKKVLRIGAQGEAVTELQYRLRGFGYDLKGTGYFGGATDTAVRDFQRLNGLTVDGEVGADTAATIDERAKPAAGPIADHIARPLWLIEALKWINLHEGQGSSDNPTILEWAKEEGGNIARVYTHDSIAWCALYANMILTKVGLIGTETLWALDFDTSKNFITLAGPAVGAFAPMVRAGGGHIAVVVGRTPDGNLACVGGNQSDKVSIAAFPPSRPRHFRWPVGVAPPSEVGFASLPIVNNAGIVLSRREG